MFILPDRKDCLDENGVYSEKKFLDICQYLVKLHEEIEGSEPLFETSGSVTIWPESKNCLGEDGRISEKKFKEEFARLNPSKQFPK